MDRKAMKRLIAFCAQWLPNPDLRENNQTSDRASGAGYCGTQKAFRATDKPAQTQIWVNQLLPRKEGRDSDACFAQCAS